MTRVEGRYRQLTERLRKAHLMPGDLPEIPDFAPVTPLGRAVA